MNEFKPKKSVALSGVVAGNTAISTVGRRGNYLHYRGYEIADLAKNCEFEEAARLVTDGICEQFGLIGTPAACRARLLALRDAGVYPIIYPLPRPGRVVEDHLATLDLVAGYVAG